MRVEGRRAKGSAGRWAGEQGRGFREAAPGGQIAAGLAVTCLVRVQIECGRENGRVPFPKDIGAQKRRAEKGRERKEGGREKEAGKEGGKEGARRKEEEREGERERERETEERLGWFVVRVQSSARETMADAPAAKDMDTDAPAPAATAAAAAPALAEQEDAQKTAAATTTAAA